MHSLAYEGFGDSKTYHFQSIFVVEVAMEVWVGGKQIVETGCYCSRHSWLWVLEEHYNEGRSFLKVQLVCCGLW